LESHQENEIGGVVLTTNPPPFVPSLWSSGRPPPRRQRRRRADWLASTAGEEKGGGPMIGEGGEGGRWGGVRCQFHGMWRSVRVDRTSQRRRVRRGGRLPACLPASPSSPETHKGERRHAAPVSRPAAHRKRGRHTTQAAPLPVRRWNFVPHGIFGAGERESARERENRRLRGREQRKGGGREAGGTPEGAKGRLMAASSGPATKGGGTDTTGLFSERLWGFVS
jgi:hypothetical protein